MEFGTSSNLLLFLGETEANKIFHLHHLTNIGATEIVIKDVVFGTVAGFSFFVCLLTLKEF
jgi:hypothetical protein